MTCNLPGDEHDPTVRLYPGGWRCDRHSPWATAGRPEPRTVQAADTTEDTTR